MSSVFSEDIRSPPFPDCHFVTQLVTSSWYAAPTAVIGWVADFGCAKMFRKVSKFLSGLRIFDFSDAFVVGTLRIPFENVASADEFVVR